MRKVNGARIFVLCLKSFESSIPCYADSGVPEIDTISGFALVWFPKSTSVHRILSEFALVAGMKSIVWASTEHAE